MVLIFKNFLPVEECNQLNDWVDIGVKNNWLDKGISRGSGWEYEGRLTTRKYGNRFENPQIVYKTQTKIDKFLNITDLPKSVFGGGKDGVVVSCTFAGGDVYAHKDPMEGSLHVLRCNIMTRNSEMGGKLYINNKKIDINVGDLHCYLPSAVVHFVTEIKGKTSRVMWMFGYQCSLERFNKLCQSHKPV